MFSPLIVSEKKEKEEKKVKEVNKKTLVSKKRPENRKGNERQFMYRETPASS